MLNFKLRKGEIATLLTLGLVVVGTLITLGTSLLVNNKKNIASNPKAAAPKSGCIDYSNYCSSDCRLDKPTYSCLADSSSGQKKWCCPPGAISALTPKPSATTPKPSGGENYPADDSCWLLKCWKGQKQMLKYAGSLKKNSMPLTSCQGGSPYSGGGWMVIGEDKANNALDTFNCEGNEEITLVPTKPPSKTCGEYAQGDHFCSGKNQMWCDNGVKKKVVTCEIGCKDGNCVPYNSTPTPPVATIPTLPTTNNTDDQKCIDRFQTANAYCGARPCTKKDNVGGKVVDYVSSNFLCASGFFGKEYVCCVRNDVNLNPTNAPTNKLLPTAIPNTGDAGDDKKCKDAFNTQYAFCTATACGPRKAVINGQSYSYKVQDYICNINNLTIATINFKCCVAEPFINNLTVVSNTTSVQTPVTTSGGEQGVLINLPGGTAFIKNSEL